MVFSNASKNCSNTVKSRPPLVVFTVCLLGIITTTLSLAYYVHTQDKILNVDAKDDWLSLLKHLNSYDVCVTNTAGTGNNKNPHSDTKMVSLASYAKASKLSSTHAMHVQGFVPLEGWSSKCPDKTDVPEHLHVAFTLPKIVQNTTQEVNICVILTGPAAFMPKITEQTLCESPTKLKKWGKLTTKLSNVEQKSFCASGSLGKLEYDIDYSKNLNFDMFLSQADRLVINSHLIVTSCFLVFIVLLITCYTLIKSRNSNAGDSKQLLMSKGMYL